MTAPKRTPERVRECHDLRQSGLSWTEIGRQVGIDRTTVRTWLDPEFDARRLKRLRGTRAKHHPYKVGTRLHPNASRNRAEQRPPESDYLARLAEIPPDTRTLSARLLGDPVPGRSALDRRRTA